MENSERQKDPKTQVETMADMPAVCLLEWWRLLGESRLYGATGSDHNGLQDC